MASRWDDFWFGRSSLARLAAFRIVLLVTALYAVFKFRATLYAPGSGWHPIFALHLLGVGRPSAETVQVVEVALLAAIALGLVGLFTRAACAVVAVLLLLWIGAAYSIREPHHDCIALAFGLAALPFAPVGARLSLDAALERRRRAARGEDPRRLPARAELAALPLRVTQVTVALGYFASGATKLAVSGPEWANGYTLQAIMLQFHSPLTDLVVHSVPLCAALSIATLAVQTGFPLVFVLPASRWVLLPGAVAFHLATWQTMATGPFVTLWFTLAAFLPLERAPLALRRTMGRAAPPWPTARRVAWGLLWTGGAALVLGTLTRFVPPLALIALVPVGAAVVLALVPARRVELRVDLRSAAARRLVALVAALDWAGRVRVRDLRGDGDAAAPAEVVTARGGVRDPRDVAAVLARNLPLALPLWPLAALHARR